MDTEGPLMYEAHASTGAEAAASGSTDVDKGKYYI